MGFVVPASSTIRNQASAVRLARYAQRIEYSECAFFGVNWSGNFDYQCRNIWSQFQRDTIAFYLAEAEREIETELGYFVQPRWVAGSLATQPDGNFRLVDEQDFTNGIHLTRYGYVIEGGVRATTLMQAGVVVNHAADPATVTVAIGAAAIDEVVVYHPGTTVQIDPSNIVVSGLNYVISIPRCRMVLASLVNNPSTGLDYDTIANFEATVDVYRVYNDPSTNASITHRNRCTNPACSETGQDGCIYIRDARIGRIEVSPATYTDGAWARACLPGCRSPYITRLYYRAGLQVLDEQLEDAIIRLAHSKMPNEPCGCVVTQRMWERDRFVPQVISRERAGNPFGLSDGAWTAWRFVSTRKLYRAQVM